MLAKFANLGSLEDLDDVAEFLRRYGELQPGLGEHGCRTLVNMFRKAWEAKTAEEKERVSGLLNFMLAPKCASGLILKAILEVPGVHTEFVPSPRVVTDFGSGKLRIEPESLLHWLVMSLSACRNRLARCERQDCKTPLYVRMHARQRYCSRSCANLKA
jgi:hypothetical protein